MLEGLGVVGSRGNFYLHNVRIVWNPSGLVKGRENGSSLECLLANEALRYEEFKFVEA